MMKICKFIVLAVIVLGFQACGTTSNTAPYKVMERMELSMNDLQFLGETTISCEYDTYLGFIRHLTSVNDEEYVPGNDIKLKAFGNGLSFRNKGMRLAAMKVLNDYPEATYFKVVMDTKNTEVTFLGSSTRRTAKVRAYKFKN